MWKLNLRLSFSYLRKTSPILLLFCIFLPNECGISRVNLIALYIVPAGGQMSVISQGCDVSCHVMYGMQMSSLTFTEVVGGRGGDSIRCVI